MMRDRREGVSQTVAVFTPQCRRPESGFAKARLGRLAFLNACWMVVCGLAAVARLAQADTGSEQGASESKKLRFAPAATFENFPDWVSCASFSPDGARLAAGSYGVVRIFDLSQKQEVATLRESSGFVKSLTYSPDGKYLLTGSYQQAAIWNAATGEKLRTLKGHRGYVTGITFAGDSLRFATASDDETVRLWSLEAAEPLLVLRDFRFPVAGVAISTDSQFLAAASGDPSRPAKKGEVLVYSLSGELLHRLEGHERAAHTVAFSPDGRILASGSADESIKFWDTTTGQLLKNLEGHSRPVNSLAFLPEGEHLLSCSGGRAVGGNEIKLWRVSDGRDLGTLAAHSAPIQHLALASDARSFATSSLDKSVKVWQVDPLLKATGEAVSLLSPETFGFKKREQPAKPATPQQAPRTEPEANRPAPPKLPQETTTRGGALRGGHFLLASAVVNAALQEPKSIRVGIIGLDTSHATAFTQILNDPSPKDDVARCRVVAAYPKGSPDIPSSTSRVPAYTEEVKKHGVEIVDSIEALVEKVDAVLLETNDGRPHLEQILPVLKAGKPVFVDKPIAGSLVDAVAIFEAARHYKTPLFSSSSLRYSSGAQAIRGGKIGEVKGCDAYSPCALEATHPDLFWYGIHGVETLFTIMGPGCESVTRVSTPGIDLAAGAWKGGRVGTFRGIRTDAGGGASGYGGQAFGTKGIEPIGSYEGYRPLLVEIVKFFREGKVPITEEETLEIYAFMEAADESKRQGGAPVKIETVLAKARASAAEKLKPLLK